jgi:hypothetical protein
MTPGLAETSQRSSSRKRDSGVRCGTILEADDCVLIPAKSKKFQIGDIVRFPFGEAGGNADGTVVFTGVSFGLQRKVRIATVASRFEIDEADVELVSRPPSTCRSPTTRR